MREDDNVAQGKKREKASHDVYMGGAHARNKRAGRTLTGRGSKIMDDREKISTGPNAEPLNENIAGTAPGIADDSLAPGEAELPQAPSDEDVEEAAKKLGAPQGERDTLPLDGE